LVQGAHSGYRQNRKSELATAMRALGQCLFEVGRVDEAFVTVHEALEIFESIGVEPPDQDFVAVQHMLATILSSRGQDEAALQLAISVVQQCRTLLRSADVQFCKRRFQSDLATALLLLANQYLGYHEIANALAAAEESVMINRVLSAEIPDAYSDRLASSLI